MATALTYRGNSRDLRSLRCRSGALGRVHIARTLLAKKKEQIAVWFSCASIKAKQFSILSISLYFFFFCVDFICCLIMLFFEARAFFLSLSQLSLWLLFAPLDIFYLSPIVIGSIAPNCLFVAECCAKKRDVDGI